MLKEEVGEEEIAKIVSKWTGIPVGRLLEGEIQKLVHMEERLRQRVVGQDVALATRGECDSPKPLRLKRPEPSDWLVPVSWAHRRRQNGTGSRPR